MTTGPVDTSRSPYARWRTLPLDGVSLGEGFWARRQAVNRGASLEHGWEQLEAAGNLNNLRLAAGGGEGEFRGMWFADSDVYKWLEAVAYDLAGNPDAELQARIFRLLRIDDAEAQARFGFFLDALQYGTPPHGGIALGLDRIVALLAGESSIRDVMAFPKAAGAVDLMAGSPSAVDRRQLRELHLDR